MKSYKEVIELEKTKPYYSVLKQKIQQARKDTIVYPPKDKIFRAFNLVDISNLKVVILGQDPYHNPDQAQGLAFSVLENVKNPPSLNNILKEVKSDLGYKSQCQNGDLTPWAKEGVLLINTILTVNKNQPKSHHGFGWEIFSDNIIKYISANLNNIVFLLWGADAIQKSKLIDTTKHHIITAPHPSPLSAYRGFFGSKCFSRANEYLIKNSKTPINW